MFRLRRACFAGINISCWRLGCARASSVTHWCSVLLSFMPDKKCALTCKPLISTGMQCAIFDLQEAIYLNCVQANWELRGCPMVTGCAWICRRHATLTALQSFVVFGATGLCSHFMRAHCVLWTSSHRSLSASLVSNPFAEVMLEGTH